MSVSRGGGRSGRRRAAPLHIMMGVAIVCIALPGISPGQVQGVWIIGPALRWAGERLVEAGVDVAVSEVVKKALKLDDCPDCEEKLQEVEQELQRQADAAGRTNGALTAELLGVRNELASLQALDQGRVNDAAAAYRESLRQLKSVPELRQQVENVRADVAALQASLQDIKAVVEEMRKQISRLQDQSDGMRTLIEALSARLNANRTLGGGNSGTAGVPVQQWPSPPSQALRPAPHPASPPPPSPIRTPAVVMWPGLWGYRPRTRGCVMRPQWVRGLYGQLYVANFCAPLR